MAAEAIFAGSAGDDRLNPVFTLGLAAAGTALVLAGLLFAFSHQAIMPPASARMLLRVIEAPIALPSAAPSKKRANSAPAANSPHAVALPPAMQSEVLPELQALRAPSASKLDLSMGIPPPTVPLPTGPSAHAFNPYSDLYRALNSPPKPPILKNGQTLRLVGHKPITKIAGRCYEEAHLPSTGLSSSSGQSVFKMVQCPGEYQPSMGEELDIWAKREKKKLDGNGSG